MNRKRMQMSRAPANYINWHSEVTGECSIRCGALIAREMPHSINNYMQHTFWGKHEGEWESVYARASACRAV